MSHRAVVGLPAPDDSVALYHSQNGANSLKVYPVLEACIAAGDPHQITSMEEPPDEVTADAERIKQSFGETAAEEPLVEPEPYATGIAPDDIGNEVDYVRYEAVVLPAELVPDVETRNSVAVYLPVFVDVAIILFFAKYADVEIYPRDSLPADPKAALKMIRDGDATPDHTVAGAEFLTIDEQPEIYEHFIESHQGLLQTLYGAAGDAPQEYLTSVVTEDTYIIARIDSEPELLLPDPVGQGILVRLPVEDFPYDQLVNLYRDWKYLANRLRVQHSITTAEDVLSRDSAASVAGFDASDHERALVSEAKAEFGDEVSALTPSRYQQG